MAVECDEFVKQSCQYHEGFWSQACQLPVFDNGFIYIM
jgi:hypothetical protein